MVKQNAPLQSGVGLSLEKRCRLLSVSRAGLYYKPVGESEQNLELMKLIDRIYLAHPHYGVRQMTEELRRNYGKKVNHKRIARLYRLMGLRSLAPGPHTSKPEPGAQKYPYFLRNLVIERRNQAWAIDITWIPMKRGHMYLCAIIDLYSRYVVGWSVSNTMEAAWVCSVVKEAIAEHGVPRVLNSDQGGQFTGEEYIRLLHDRNIQPSMDGKGRALDNIFIERLWRSVKYEHVYLYPANDGLEVYQGLQRYFDWYNSQRFHSSLDYKVPKEVYHMAA